MHVPVRGDRNCTRFAISEAGDVVGGGFEVEDRLLDVGARLVRLMICVTRAAGDAGNASEILDCLQDGLSVWSTSLIFAS